MFTNVHELDKIIASVIRICSCILASKRSNSKCHVILDFAEAFIEQSQSLNSETYTSLDYKQHNTIKCLVGINPNGFITFLSYCYSDRASDQYITKYSDFLRSFWTRWPSNGFQIKEELLLHFCSSTKCSNEKLDNFCRSSKKAKLGLTFDSMLNEQLFESKIIENWKILLQSQLLQYIDDVLWTCAVLCKFKPKRYCSRKEEDKSNVWYDYNKAKIT